MAKDVDQIRVGANGTVRVAPVGTAAPADESAAPGVGWVDLGYLSEDGVRLQASKTVEDVAVWQLFYPGRKIVTGRSLAVGFVLRQWSKDTTELALEVTVTEPTPGHYKLTPNDPETIDERALMVDWVDGDHNYRLIIPRGMATDDVETNLRRSEASDLPVTFGIIGSDAVDPWYVLTDDPAFEAA